MRLEKKLVLVFSHQKYKYYHCSMSYAKKISARLFYYVRYKLSNIEKIIYLILSALLIVSVMEFIVKNIYAVGIATGITLLLIVLYLYLKRKKGITRQNKLNNLEDKNNSTINYDINTSGGNYNELIQGNYIQGDYINIQGKPIDINQDISQIMGEFQNILTKLVNQGCSTEEALIQLANDLTNEAQNKPRIKSKFFIDKDADISEIQEEFINRLINSYSSQSPITNFSKYLASNAIYENSCEYEEVINYKGYKIYLEVDKDDNWHYKIDGLSFNETGESWAKHFAIDEAKGKIDEERFSNW
jgi:uncharacterized protein YoaH (UPF0181 family)